MSDGVSWSRQSDLPGDLPQCRVMSTRTCPPIYDRACGDLPCARFESDDEAPWQLSDSTPTVGSDGSICWVPDAIDTP